MSVVLPPRPDDGALGPVGRAFPIVPEDGAAGRTLVAVIAALAFLAALATGAASLVAAHSAQWRASLSEEATIQLRPGAGRDEEADIARAVALARATPGIRAAEPVSRREAERLLEPWLGPGLDLSELPVPRLVALKLGSGGRAELPRLALRLKIEMPGASLDDHGAWLARLSALTTGAVLAALAVVALVLLASAGAIAFATRGAVLGHRDIVEVLHLVGGAPRFVIGLFARRFARLGLVGGLIGSLAAVVLTGLASAVLGGLAQSFSPHWWSYAAIALIAPADCAVAAWVAAATVKRFLKDVR